MRVRGARPGDVLQVEVLEVRPRADFGWTAIRPGRGLLPEAEFPEPYLVIWDLSDGVHARMPGRHMIAHLVRERGLSREQAYVLASVCVDLSISEIVDAPHWIVSAALPERVFG